MPSVAIHQPVVAVGGDVDGEALGLEPALTAAAILWSSSTTSSFTGGPPGLTVHCSHLTGR